MVTTKKCNRCFEVKPIADFQKNTGMADGHFNQCRVCRNAQIKLTRKPRVGLRVVSPEQRKRWRKNNPTKHAAHRIVERAVREYGFPRKPCEVCGEPQAQAHHDDYSKPLDVRWLCFKHHRELHISLRSAA